MTCKTAVPFIPHPYKYQNYIDFFEFPLFCQENLCRLRGFQERNITTISPIPCA